MASGSPPPVLLNRERPVKFKKMVVLPNPGAAINGLAQIHEPGAETFVSGSEGLAPASKECFDRARRDWPATHHVRP